MNRASGAKNRKEPLETGNSDDKFKKSRRDSIMLVNAPNSKELGDAGNYANFSAIGVVSLGTRILKDYPGVTVKVIDGGVSSMEEILGKIDEVKPNVLGLSVLTSTYENGLRIARHAKESCNSKTVLGNDHAGFFPELILKQRQYVDYVVAAEVGEKAFSFIVAKELGLDSKYSFPNKGEDGIYFRNGDSIEVIRFPTENIRKTYRDEKDFPNVELISEDYSRVVENYNKAYGSFHDTKVKPFIVNNIRGCGKWKAPCIECSLRDLRMNAGDPIYFWKMVDHYNEKYGMNFFFEVGDSFLSYPNYVQELIQTMPFNPKDRGIEFEVYARANDIVNNEDALNWMKSLNITRVMIGLESGDDKMLESINKGNRNRNLSPSQINLEALKRLDKSGITFHASFVLGILGETRETLNHTLDFMENIAQSFKKHLATLEASALIPLPNSPAWDYLLSKNTSRFGVTEESITASMAKYDLKLSDEVKTMLRNKYEDKDMLDTHELGKDWIKYFTHINWEDIESTIKKATAIGKKTNCRVTTHMS